MATRRRKKTYPSYKPILAKLWWASLPVFIAAQGWVFASPVVRGGNGDSCFSAEHFWPIAEDLQGFEGYPLSAIVDRTSPLVIHKTEREDVPVAQKPGLERADSKLDWFAQQKPSSERFRLPEGIARTCTEQQSSHFDLSDEPQPANYRPYLCRQELVQKIAAVASGLGSIASSDRRTGQCLSAFKNAPTAWGQLDYAYRECAPTCSLGTMGIPVFAGNGPNTTYSSGLATYGIASSSRYNVGNQEANRPKGSDLAHIPHFANAAEQQVSSAKIAEHRDGQWSAKSLLATKESCPECIYHEHRTPALLTSGTILSSIAEASHGSQTLSDVGPNEASALSPVFIVSAHRFESHPRSIPHLICEGCTTTYGQMAHEEQGTTGAWGIVAADRIDVAHRLAPFTTLPKMLHASCDLSSPSADDAFARALDGRETLAHKTNELVLGGGRENYDATDSIDQSHWARTAHLFHPLAAQRAVAAYAGQDNSAIWSLVAASPRLLLAAAKGLSCIGSECPLQLGRLTQGHPTAALAAFDGTDYRDISDIRHLSPFTTKDLAPTDPCLYCDKSAMGLTTFEDDTPEFLQTASRTFWKLARDTSFPGEDHHQDVARSTPDPRNWAVPVKAVAQLAAADNAALNQQHSSLQAAYEPQQTPNYWTVLDRLVEEHQGSQLAGARSHTGAPQQFSEQADQSSRLARESTFLGRGQGASRLDGDIDAFASSLQSLRQKRMPQNLETDSTAQAVIERQPLADQSIFALAYEGANPRFEGNTPLTRSAQVPSHAFDEKNLIAAARQVSQKIQHDEFLDALDLASSDNLVDANLGAVVAPDFGKLLFSAAADVLPPARSPAYDKPVVSADAVSPLAVRGTIRAKREAQEALALAMLADANQASLQYPEVDLHQLKFAQVLATFDADAAALLEANEKAELKAKEVAALAAIENAKDAPLQYGDTDLHQLKLAQTVSVLENNEAAALEANQATALAALEGKHAEALAALDAERMAALEAIADSKEGPLQYGETDLHQLKFAQAVAALDDNEVAAQEAKRAAVLEALEAKYAEALAALEAKRTVALEAIADAKVAPLQYGETDLHQLKLTQALAALQANEAAAPDANQTVLLAEMQAQQAAALEAIADATESPLQYRNVDLHQLQLAQALAVLDDNQAAVLQARQAKALEAFEARQALAVTEVKQVPQQTDHVLVKRQNASNDKAASVLPDFCKQWLAKAIENSSNSSSAAPASLTDHQIYSISPLSPDGAQKNNFPQKNSTLAIANVRQLDQVQPSDLLADVSFPQIIPELQFGGVLARVVTQKAADTVSDLLTLVQHSPSALSVMAASAGPTPTQLDPILSQTEAQALGLDIRGLGKDGAFSADEMQIAGRQHSGHVGEAHTAQDAANLGLLADAEEGTPNKLTATSMAGGAEALQTPNTVTGSLLCKNAVCSGSTYAPTDRIGETGKPIFDPSQLKQLNASVQPKDMDASQHKRHPDLWTLSPGPGSQTVTPHGKVPGGFDVASGHTGVSRPVELGDAASQVRSLRDGYHYYIGDGTTPSMSTSLDHLQISGALTQLPGTTPDDTFDGLAADFRTREKVGLYDTPAQSNQTVLSLAPSIDSAWGVDSRRVPKEQKIDSSVSLSSKETQGISNAIATVASTGKERHKFVKVVDVDAQRQMAKSAGKVTRAAEHSSIDSAARHRFAVEVVPHVDNSEPNNMHLLVGRASGPKSEISARTDSSFLIDVAYAADVAEVGAAREPASFLSVGAPSYPIAERDWDDSWLSNDSTLAVGAVNNDREDYDVDDNDYSVALAAPGGDPGIDPFGRKPTALGVRREGRLWDDNGPWFDSADDHAVSRTERQSPQMNRYEGRRPPDKEAGAPRYGANAMAADEATISNERELDGSFQKKNRTVETERYQREEDYGSVRSDSEADFSSAPLAEADDHVKQPDNSSAGTPNGEWQLAPPSRTLTASPEHVKPTVEAPTEELVAQQTLFDSGVPAAKPKSTEVPVKPAIPPPVEHPKEEEQQEGLLINFRDVAITEYIRLVAQQTGKNFIFNDKDLNFNITVISEQPTTMDNLLAALLQELRIHGLQVLEQGNNIIIHANDKTKGPTRIVKGDQKDTHETALVTRVFQLDSIPADKMKAVVTPMLSGQALVQVLSDTNNLLITDFGDNVEKIADLINTLDRPTTAFQIGQYVGRNNFIENLIPLAEGIIRPFAEKHDVVFVPHLATNSVFIVSSPVLVKRAIGILEQLDALEGATKILTLEDLSKGGAALTNPQGQGPEEIIGPQRPKTQQEIDEEARANAELEKARTGTSPAANLLKEKGEGHEHEATPTKVAEHKLPVDHITQTKFYIHKLQYRKGDQLQSALQAIADSLRMSETANVDLVNAINSAQWIDSSNSLVVTGTAESLGRVQELINEIDIPLRQVFLEMLILDTTITDSLTFSVDFGSQFGGYQNAGVQGWSGDTPATSTSANPLFAAIKNSSLGDATNITTSTVTPYIINAAGLMGVTAPGMNLGIIGRRILKGGQFFNTVGALVQAIHGDTQSDIILNPKIMVEDNQSAEIFVGESLAFQTQNVVNDSGSIISQNIEFRDVGTTLNVTVQIGNNDIITLDIKQEVSATINTTSGGSGGGGSQTSTNLNAGPATSQSRTITRVHVPNEYFVVISGMIRQDKGRVREQIPCIGGLPFLGALSARKDNTDSRRNVMIFIRPQIIDTDWDYDDVTRRQQNAMIDKGRRKPRWKYEADEGLDFLNLPRINEHCEDDSYLPGWWDDP